MIGSNDIPRSKTFYDAFFRAIGGEPGVQDASGRLIYAHNGGRFMVTKPIDGKVDTHANGGTIGFTMASPEQANAWHTRRARRMEAGRSRTHQAFVKVPRVRCISPICVTLTATSRARYIA
jgi:hypothetical protein